MAMSRERRTPMRAVQVSAECACGGDIKQVPFGRAEFGSPPRIEHKCDMCGVTHWEAESFPKIEFEPMS
jgi:hypothetical protein